MELSMSGSENQGGGTIYTVLARTAAGNALIGLHVDQHERWSRQGRLSSRYRSAQGQIERSGAHSPDDERLES